MVLYKHSKEKERKKLKRELKEMLNNQRTFGVEIEFTSADRGAVKRELRQRGIMEVSIGYYHHTAPEGYWKIESDSSCESELITPPLKGEAGLEKVKKACEALNAAGAKVDSRCGLHVHHDAADLKHQEVKVITDFYLKYEEGLDKLVPESRRADNNHYCQTLRKENAENFFDKINNTNSISQIRDLLKDNYGRDRYNKLNLKAYRVHGTLEFRQHSGTTDYQKISNWIKLTQGIIERGTRPNTFISWRGKRTAEKLLSMKEIEKDVRTFYRERKTQLSIPYRERQNQIA